MEMFEMTMFGTELALSYQINRTCLYITVTFADKRIISSLATTEIFPAGQASKRIYIDRN
jgi:hypothetical protein